MTGTGWNELPPDLRALAARWKARKPRRDQRAEYRAVQLAKAEANRRAFGVVRPKGGPQSPPAGVS